MINMDRKQAIERLKYDREMCYFNPDTGETDKPYSKDCEEMATALDIAISVMEMDQRRYERHYDHTDCIWYRPEARNRCPTTCAQYRDGWNDAMDYIFRNGAGYRPYRRDKRYE